LGQKKLAQAQHDVQAALLQADAARIPCADASFDAVTCAFGIRNVTDYPAALKEMHRVLRPEGRVLILEFAMPPNPVFRAAYLLYFRHVLPRLGALLSRDRAAYRYLNQSVEAFPSGAAFCAAVAAAGFTSVRARPLTWGIAALYSGEKE